MIENKYYVPDVTEFRVGFEFELMDEFGSYHKYKCCEDTLKTIFKSVDISRVKYLDQEDIESFGFEFTGEDLIFKYYKKFLGLGTGDDYSNFIDYDEETRIIDLYRRSNRGNEDIIIENITIKNKSELQVLLKQLAII